MSASITIQPGHSETELADAPARGKRNALWKIAHEPLVHFLLLGALIFAASSIVSKYQDDTAHRIVIGKNLAVHFITLYQAQMGVLPSKTQLDGMIEDYIHEEIGFREARRLGLDKDDEIVRRRLASKFAFLQSDLVTVPEPSAEELRRYYDSHRKNFLQPANVTFTHIYFSLDHGGDSAALSRAQQTLMRLQTRTVRAPGLGDRFPLQMDYAGLARLDLVQQFGDSPIVDSVFAIPVGQWSGPVRSGYGWHLVYVSHREEAAVPPLQEIQDKVKAAYIDDAKEKANQARYDALAKQYVVDRAYLR